MRATQFAFIVFASFGLLACPNPASTPQDAGRGDAAQSDAMLATDMLVPQDLETMDASGDDASLDGGDASLDGGDGGGWTFPTDSCARAFFASGSDPLAPSPAAQLTDILDACPALKSAIMWQNADRIFRWVRRLGRRAN